MPLPSPPTTATGFRFPVPYSLLKVLCRLQQNGFRTVIVGGALRDYLLGQEVSDYDLASDALPQQVQQLFHRCLATGLKHGTVTVLEGQASYEITSFRNDGIYKDGRHPENVEFTGDLEGDLARRDFSMNAIAFEANAEAAQELLQDERERARKQTAGCSSHHLLYLAGLLHDHHNGRLDLQQGIIRAIGRAYQRFEEDALRMLRACRFSAKLGFCIEEQTFTAICQLHQNLGKVSRPRIQGELSKLLCSLHVLQGLRYLSQSGLWYQVFPGPQSEGDPSCLPVLPTTTEYTSRKHHAFAAESSLIPCDWERLWMRYQEFCDATKLQKLSKLSAGNWLSDLFCLAKKLEGNPYLQWQVEKVPRSIFAWTLLHFSLLEPVCKDSGATDTTASRAWWELEEELDSHIQRSYNRHSRRQATQTNGSPLPTTLVAVAERGLKQLLFPKRETEACLQLLRCKQLIWSHQLLYRYQSLEEPEQRYCFLRRYLAAMGLPWSFPALCFLGLHNQWAAEMQSASANFQRLLWQEFLSDLQIVLAAQPVLELKQLAIDGRSLAYNCGIPNGPDIGRILQELLYRVLREPQCNTPNILESSAQEIYQNISREEP